MTFAGSLAQATDASESATASQTNIARPCRATDFSTPQQPVMSQYGTVECPIPRDFAFRIY
jgi:hypothetical protein